MSGGGRKGISYRDSGVDRNAGDRTADVVGKMARSTYGPQVLGGVGGFAGLFSLGGEVNLFNRRLVDPVLVACTDGVGTKLKLAFMTGVHDTIGIDLVAMNVNDLIVQGAEPLFFLDYYATGKLDEKVFADVMKGIAEGCRQGRCSLIGGETAEMPGFYREGEYDLAGFCVGVVERGKIIDGEKVAAGDVIIGVSSNGLHSNGYSLARKVLFDIGGMRVDQRVPELGCTLGEELLRPTRIYVDAVLKVLARYRVKEIVRSLAHITGSGLPGNTVRTVPRGLILVFKKGSWPVPPVFDIIRRIGNIEEREMYDTFNMGIGMTLICPPFNADAIVRTLEEAGYPARIVGEIVAADDKGVEPEFRLED